MDSEEAYQTLKDDLDIDTENLYQAYRTAIDQPESYIIAVEDNYNKIKMSMEVGQSPLALGELARQFYNATHRNINGKIIDLVPQDFNERLGIVASESLQQIAVINQMTEEMAGVQLSCNETVDMSYM